MDASMPPVNQTDCHIYEVCYSLLEARCNRCGQAAPHFSMAERTAIDIDLEQPVLLHVRVSVHYCTTCHHYFRAQPPFLRCDAIYTNRVVSKAVEAIYQDGMALRRVTMRLARDFWVRPSESMLRHWGRVYSASFDFVTEYQPWVVGEFSGILCVDEVYQGQLALLLAVDSAAPDGDRLVGYQLVSGSVEASDVEVFLTHLKTAGIDPAEVITDGSALYPRVLSKVWPQAAHQLCLFHETRHVTAGAMKLINGVRRSLPVPPSSSTQRGARSLRPQPPSDDPLHPARQHWEQRQAVRKKEVALVHQLAAQGLSQRAIARQTGFHRNTVKAWLQRTQAHLPAEQVLATSVLPIAPVPKPGMVKGDKIYQPHALAEQGLSHPESARQFGVHRVTIKSWRHQAVPTPEEPPSRPEPASANLPPPAPWASWEQVSSVREALREHRFLLLRRPEHLAEEEQAQVVALLSSPVGKELQVAHTFLIDWYRIWSDAKGQRRTFAEAQRCYEAWHTDETYAATPSLHRVQQRITPAKFEKLSQFLGHPDWEATNNGAERAGRAFRHRQAPHFNLRTKESIADSITVAACLHKQAAKAPVTQPLHTCQRGRKSCTELARPS